MNPQYDWMKFYEAAVLETHSEALLERIEAAQNAMGRRFVTSAMNEAERNILGFTEFRIFRQWRAATCKYARPGSGDGLAKRRQCRRLKRWPILKWPARQLFQPFGKTVWHFSIRR